MFFTFCDILQSPLYNIQKKMNVYEYIVIFSWGDRWNEAMEHSIISPN